MHLLYTLNRVHLQNGAVLHACHDEFLTAADCFPGMQVLPSRKHEAWTLQTPGKVDIFQSLKIELRERSNRACAYNMLQ